MTGQGGNITVFLPQRSEQLCLLYCVVLSCKILLLEHLIFSEEKNWLCALLKFPPQFWRHEQDPSTGVSEPDCSAWPAWTEVAVPASYLQGWWVRFSEREGWQVCQWQPVLVCFWVWGDILDFYPVMPGVPWKTIYNAALKASLEPHQLTPGSALLRYVDDILLCSPSKQECERDTVTLLKHFHCCGHKASLSKLQFVQDKVTFLGHVISKDGHSLSPKRVVAVQNIPKPVTKKQLISS